MHSIIFLGIPAKNQNSCTDYGITGSRMGPSDGFHIFVPNARHVKYNPELDLESALLFIFKECDTSWYSHLTRNVWEFYILNYIIGWWISFAFAIWCWLRKKSLHVTVKHALTSWYLISKCNKAVKWVLCLSVLLKIWQIVLKYLKLLLFCLAPYPNGTHFCCTMVPLPHILF